MCQKCEMKTGKRNESVVNVFEGTVVNKKSLRYLEDETHRIDLIEEDEEFDEEV